VNDLFEKNLAVARVQAEGILQPENPTRTGPKFWFAGEVAPPTIRLLALAECLPSRPDPDCGVGKLFSNLQCVHEKRRPASKKSLTPSCRPRSLARPRTNPYPSEAAADL
jgi:hypothetical protein